MTKNLNWSSSHERDYNALFNTYTKATNKKLDINNYIDKEKRNLLTFINNHDGYQDSRKKSLLFMVARYLTIKKDRYADNYRQPAYELYQHIQETEEKGIQSEKEKEFYMSIPTIHYIIDNTPWTESQHFNYLLLNIISKQPPLRPDFYTTCKIIFQKKDDNKTDNFIFINKKTKQINYIVNNDKISKSYKPKNIIEITDNDLKNIIFESVKKYPRTYLFELNNKKMTQQQLTSLLRKSLNNKGITFSMIRSAYINNYYLYEPSKLKRKELAHNMRHSHDTALTNYNKINPIEKESCDDIRAKLNLLTIEDNNNNPSEEQQDKEYIKKRNNILIKINQRKSKPRPDTIIKYNLVFNNNKWM